MISLDVGACQKRLGGHHGHRSQKRDVFDVLDGFIEKRGHQNMEKQDFLKFEGAVPDPRIGSKDPTVG